MGEGVHQRNIGARAQRKVELSLDVRRAHEVDAARIANHETGACAQAALHLRCEDRMRLGGIGADDYDDIRVLHRVEVLGAGGGAVGLPEAVSGGRVANPRAGVDIVVAERGPHHLLHHPHFLVGAAGGGDAADGLAAVPGLRRLQSGCGERNRLLPTHFPPRIGSGLAHHRLGDAILVVGIAPGEAPLDAGVAVVGLAVLVRNHAHHLVALHLGAEGAADAAIGASGGLAAVRHTVVDDGFLHQRGGGTGLHAGAAGDALRGEEIVGAGGNLGFEPPPVDREGEGALHLGAGTNAARAGDALGRIEREVGVRLVLGLPQVVVAIGVAHLAQAHGASHVLQFTVAVRGAGEAVERMIGDVELHHAPSHPRHLLGLGPHRHGRARPARCRRRSARAGLRPPRGTCDKSRTP